jgi:Ran GTPase-activating protein (RanGAP) involved in mRNA processing and transport
VLLQPLVDGIAAGTAYASVKLSGMSFSVEAADVAAAALASLPAATLNVADFSDTISGRPQEDAVVILEKLCAPLVRQQGSLECFDLSDNALGAKGVRAVRCVRLAFSICCVFLSSSRSVHS